MRAPKSSSSSAAKRSSTTTAAKASATKARPEPTREYEDEIHTESVPTRSPMRELVRGTQLTPHEHFRKFLQDGQYRITGERFDVLDAVLAWDDHFDADNLFIYLKNAGSKVSRATVYKTLNLLHECGLVSRYRFSQGHAQYEKTTGRPHHDHMVCTKCGKIIEFENSRVERLQEDACAKYGFAPIYHSFQIFGICLDCRTNTAGPNGSARPHAVQSHSVTGIPGSGGVLPFADSKHRSSR